MNNLNPSDMPPLTNQASKPATVSPFFQVGKSYWVTYPYIWYRIQYGTKQTVDKIATEQLICLAVNGDTGLFDTDYLDHQWVHKTRCVLAETAPKREKGFWESLFS